QGVIEGGDELAGTAVARGVEELDRHQLDVPGEAGDALGVVPRRADDAGDTGAVAGVVPGGVGAGGGVPADARTGPGVPVGGRPVGPAALTRVVACGVLDHRRQDVAGVDSAVVVEIGDLAGALVDRVVEIAEIDSAVAVDIGEVGEAAG